MEEIEFYNVKKRAKVKKIDKNLTKKLKNLNYD